MGILTPFSIILHHKGSYIVIGRRTRKFRTDCKKQKKKAIISIVKLVLLDLLNFCFSGTQCILYDHKQTLQEFNG